MRMAQYLQPYRTIREILRGHSINNEMDLVAAFCSSQLFQLSQLIPVSQVCDYQMHRASSI